MLKLSFVFVACVVIGLVGCGFGNNDTSGKTSSDAISPGCSVDPHGNPLDRDGNVCDGVCLDGACHGSCRPNTTKCNGNQPQKCDVSVRLC
jgi:hypothetical protein